MVKIRLKKKEALGLLDENQQVIKDSCKISKQDQGKVRWKRDFCFVDKCKMSKSDKNEQSYHTLVFHLNYIYMVVCNNTLKSKLEYLLTPLDVINTNALKHVIVWLKHTFWVANFIFQLWSNDKWYKTISYISKLYHR